jgi:hypothetical protein
MHPDWVRGLRDQVRTAGAMLFVKQIGSNHALWCQRQGRRPGAMAGRFAGTGIPAVKPSRIMRLARGTKRSNTVGTAGPFTVATSYLQANTESQFSSKSHLEPSLIGVCKVKPILVPHVAPAGHSLLFAAGVWRRMMGTGGRGVSI